MAKSVHVSIDEKGLRTLYEDPLFNFCSPTLFCFIQIHTYKVSFILFYYFKFSNPLTGGEKTG